MQTLFKKILFGIGMNSLFVMLFFPVMAEEIPHEYYANYELEQSWAVIDESLVQIDAANKLGKSINPILFKNLSVKFPIVFSYFPQEYSFKVTYEQCKETSEMLAQEYTPTAFQNFKNNCYAPLNQIMSKIKSQYTIRANATRSPASGPAPLTVTFDARASVDPSNETIPSEQYYRYYRDTKGEDRVIGKGHLIHYTFEEAGNYTVHLTVKSSNKSIGILDGDMNLNVSVLPKAANIVIYANAKKLDKLVPTKIGIQEAKKGVILDGTATMPTEGRKIMSHKRRITGGDDFVFTKENTGAPSNINVPMKDDGEYTVSLTTIDNENNATIETFKIIVSDPVALIRQTPLEGTTSNVYTFDGSASYSLTARIKLYTREIFNANGDKIMTAQGKNITKQFTQPGNYLVRLTLEDEVGKTNIETKSFYVESSTPIPQFTIQANNRREKSSEFTLDASSSSDLDVKNGTDELQYQRSFSNEDAVKIISNEANNKKITIQVDEIGSHTITLTVIDKYGKTAKISKDVMVRSTLRPDLTITPGAIQWGKTITGTVQTNKEVVLYQWNFGDGTPSTLKQVNQLTHKYSKIGIFNIKVTVSDAGGDSNTVTEKIFIGETGWPIAAYRIRDSRGFYLQTTETCTAANGESFDAYSIDRYQNITIDPTISVNTKGLSSDLSYFFQTQYDEVYRQNTLGYRFDEIGCQYIQLTVKDNTAGLEIGGAIRFRVHNALPTLDNLTISFPQYNNESGIGFQENNIQNILDNDNSTTLMVKVTAPGARDPDGKIGYFKWYYYNKNNPDNILDMKITPGDINYVFFSVPRIPGEYMFGVKMFDNDDASRTSEEIIGNGPTVFFPPNQNTPDMPIVNLKTDKQSVKVGEPVVFTVTAKVLSESPDFNANNWTIFYDFEGDGSFDLITKKNQVTHVYDIRKDEETYIPKVKFTYRGQSTVVSGNKVTLRSDVIPKLEYTTIGPIVIFRDMSFGNFKQRTICYEKDECEKGNTNYQEKNVVSLNSVDTLADTNYKSFIKKYAKDGTHKVTMTLLSDKGFTTGTELTLTTSKKLTKKDGKINTGVYFRTIPEGQTTDGVIRIFTNKALNDAVSFYVYYQGSGSCFIDTDTATDRKVDGTGNFILDDDPDIPCNHLQLWEYKDNVGEIEGKISYEMRDASSNSFIKKNKLFIVEFTDMDLGSKELLARKLKTLINGIDPNLGDNARLITHLKDLQIHMLEPKLCDSTIATINGFIDGGANIYLDAQQKDLFDEIAEELSSVSMKNSSAPNDFQRAKNDILALIPQGELKDEVAHKFQLFETQAETMGPDEKKVALKEILNYISANADQYEISQDDMEEVVVAQFCVMLSFYEIMSSQCNTTTYDQENMTPPEITQTFEENTVSNTGTQTTTTGLPGWLKVLLWIVIGGIAIVGGVILFFALKAKMRGRDDEEEGDE